MHIFVRYLDNGEIMKRGVQFQQTYVIRLRKQVHHLYTYDIFLHFYAPYMLPL